MRARRRSVGPRGGWAPGVGDRQSRIGAGSRWPPAARPGGAGGWSACPGAARRPSLRAGRPLGAIVSPRSRRHRRRSPAAGGRATGGATAPRQARRARRAIGPVRSASTRPDVTATASAATVITAAVDVVDGRIIDIFEGRNAADLQAWLGSQPADWVREISVVSVDPHEGYRSAITSFALLGDVTVVVDPFHIVRLANAAVTKCRQRVQQATLEHRGWKGDPLYGIRKLLLIGRAPRRTRLGTTSSSAA